MTGSDIETLVLEDSPDNKGDYQAAASEAGDVSHGSILEGSSVTPPGGPEIHEGAH